MRRSEFAVEDQEEIEAFLQEMTYGFLGTVDEEGWPLITPLNFVYHQGSVYFHGSRIGEKMSNLKRSDQVTFAVAKEYALIPSYFKDPKLACPATAFFKSVFIRGKAIVLEDPWEKAEALAAFMKKLQPEGGYAPITPEDEEYRRNIQGVAVVKISVEQLSAKFKFGQNMRGTPRDQVVEGLTQRGGAMDEETLRMMEQFCPHHGASGNRGEKTGG